MRLIHICCSLVLLRSSAAMFGRNAGKQAARKLHGDITVDSLRPNYQGTRDLSIKVL